MSLSVNEISFLECDNRHVVDFAMDRLASVIRKLSKFGVRIGDMYGCKIYGSAEICKGMSFNQYLNSMADHDRKAMLLAIMDHTRLIEDLGDSITINGIKSMGVSHAYKTEGVVLSLKSIPLGCIYMHMMLINNKS